MIPSGLKRMMVLQQLVPVHLGVGSFIRCPFVAGCYSNGGARLMLQPSSLAQTAVDGYLGTKNHRPPRLADELGGMDSAGREMVQYGQEDGVAESAKWISEVGHSLIGR